MEDGEDVVHIALGAKKKLVLQPKTVSAHTLALLKIKRSVVGNRLPASTSMLRQSLLAKERGPIKRIGIDGTQGYSLCLYRRQKNVAWSSRKCTWVIAECHQILRVILHELTRRPSHDSVEALKQAPQI